LTKNVGHRVFYKHPFRFNY